MARQQMKHSEFKLFSGDVARGCQSQLHGLLLLSQNSCCNEFSADVGAERARRHQGSGNKSLNPMAAGVNAGIVDGMQGQYSSCTLN